MKLKISLVCALLLISCNKLPDCGLVEVNDNIVYKDGELVTTKCAYYDEITGKMISSHEYKDGKFHGEWKFYFVNGKVETVGVFENGMRTGKWYYYHENGNRKGILNYLDGLPHGVWKTFNENGSLILEEKWVNGVKKLDSINNPFNNAKVDGYDVKPIIIDN